MTETARLGPIGRLARAAQRSPLTPLLALAGLLLGAVALLVTPREEEPQVDVTMATVTVALPGATALQVEQRVAAPLEQALAGIAGIRHVYSTSRPGAALVTAEFEVGIDRPTALIRLYDRLYSHRDWQPPGAGTPMVAARGIDDVPVLALTLWTDDAERDATDLARVAHTLETELKRIPGTADVYTLGAPDEALRVTLDPGRLARHGLVLDDVAQALRAAGLVREAGTRVGPDGAVPVTAGRFLAGPEEVASLVLGLADGRPLRIGDVADVEQGADEPTRYVWHGTPPGRDGPRSGRAPALTIAVTKQPGANAADITAAIAARVAAVRGELIPAGVEFAVTRDYGRSADAKARLLIGKLSFATSAVVLLAWLALGRREALVVGLAVGLTLALTLFASWAMGFTLNRVSLFALIFSVGILVDDAIVVVENIHRHLRDGRTLAEAIPQAVDEVGGPTILATLTVIAALLPMAFVTGLMGPYMRPIPINASVGMLLSLAVALLVTPWLARVLLRTGTAHAAAPAADGAFARLLRPFLDAARGQRRRGALFAAIGALVVLAAALPLTEHVVLKMLPFDDKPELQLVVNLPEGRTLEDTDAVLGELADALDREPDVASYQAYAGTSAPITFNGLVRQYDLRAGPHVGDLQVNLRAERSRPSHAIARALRPRLAAIAERHGAALTVVEVPPGPPVMAPIVAEIYGPDYARQREIGRALRERIAATPGLVDVDSSVEADAMREVLTIDRERAARLGVSEAAVTDAIAAAIGGLDLGPVVDDTLRYARPLRLRLPATDPTTLERLRSAEVRGSGGRRIALSELVRIQTRPWDGTILHKDLAPVVYVTADEAGPLDSPLYGLFAVDRRLADAPLAGQRLETFYVRAPRAGADFALKWDGEWQITYETFRDMGLAYAAGIALIYLLVVAQFRRYAMPLIILAPIPLTIVGVMPGHALLGAPFTATSMIGMIALAGIIVRNSILLVDFAERRIAAGASPEQAVVEACTIRARPIGLTALAALAGALFILDDPIFNGLAIALVSGIVVSTALTLLVIPLLYYAWRRRLLRSPP
jgi:multidrug efflux pump subunit AcrB